MNLVPPQKGGQGRGWKQPRDRRVAHAQPAREGAEGGQDQSPPVRDEAGAPHAPAMVANIAADLGVAAACVNVKGKTNEKLGYLGRAEAIEAQAVVLLTRAPA